MLFGIPHEVAIYVLIVVNSLLALIGTGLGGVIWWMKSRAKDRSDAKTIEAHRTDLQAQAATEQYSQWKDIVAILHEERVEIAKKYISVCEQLADAKAEIALLKQGKP